MIPFCENFISAFIFQQCFPKSGIAVCKIGFAKKDQAENLQKLYSVVIVYTRTQQFVPVSFVEKHI
jgi:hypothetical protein